MLKSYTWAALSDQDKQALLLRPALLDKPDLTEKVASILDQVKKGGDKALFNFCEKFDNVTLNQLKVSPEEIEEALSQVSDETKKALSRAADQIDCFHRQQMPKDIDTEINAGIRCQRQSRPIEKVGFYIPGGTAPLPSSVLMMGIPSRIAGCSQRILCTPPQKYGKIDPVIIAAAQLCGIDSIYKVGGAQAIAAMAYGSETIPSVDKIFGPGNAWVTEAKSQVEKDPQGASIDMPAGPSEVMVIADKQANPDFIAADLLSQAEHGTDSQVVLVYNDDQVLTDVNESVEKQLSQLSRRDIAAASLNHSFAIKANSREQSIAIANAWAPEHLIIQTNEPEQMIPEIKHAGSVFIGPWSPESVGDYASGTNHVLPTYGYARSVSGLSLESFLKFITFQTLTPAGLKDLGPVVEHLAALEGLSAHKNAVTVRLAELNAND